MMKKIKKRSKKGSVERLKKLSSMLRKEYFLNISSLLLLFFILIYVLIIIFQINILPVPNVPKRGTFSQKFPFSIKKKSSKISYESVDDESLCQVMSQNLTRNRTRSLKDKRVFTPT